MPIVLRLNRHVVVLALISKLDLVRLLDFIAT
jgi:hypothetical protein